MPLRPSAQTLIRFNTQSYRSHKQRDWFHKMTISLIEISYGHIRAIIGQVTVDGIVRACTWTPPHLDFRRGNSLHSSNRKPPKSNHLKRLQKKNQAVQRSSQTEWNRGPSHFMFTGSTNYSAWASIDPCESERPLHPFQEQLDDSLYRLKTQSRLLIHMPTGSGKTRTACEILLDLVRLQTQRQLLSDLSIYLWVAQSPIYSQARSIGQP